MTTTIRRPRILCRIDGREVVDVVSATCRHGFDQAISEAQITCPTRPSWVTEWSEVELWLGDNPGTLRLRFKGFVFAFDRTLFTRQCVINCKGPLVKTQMYEGTTEDGYDLSDGGDGNTDQAIVQILLGLSGLSGYYSASTIQGTSKLLGTVSDAFILKEGQSALQFIQDLDSISLGYRTFDGPGGNVVRRQVSARPSTTAALTFTQGVDIASASGNESLLDIKNRVVVEGFLEDGTTIPFTATRQQASPYIRTGDGYRTYKLSSAFLEKDEDADAGPGIACGLVAEYMVAELNQVRIATEFTTPRGDLIFPQMTIKVVSDRLESNQNYWVQSVQCTIDSQGSFSQQLQVIGGIGSTAPIVSPPIADFSYIVERESLVVSGVETLYYTVSCIDQSVATQGTIVSREWDAPDAVPTTSTELNPIFQYTDLTNKAITLTITDSQGTQDTITLDLFSNDDPQQKRRKITLAGTIRMERFDGEVWRTDLADDSTSVLVAGNGPVAGAGSLFMATETDLITNADESEPFGSSESITAIWLESDVSLSRILVGSQFGRLALSLSGGALWTVISAGPWGSTPVLRVVLNRFNSNSWRVLTAGGLYRTDNGGVNWITDLAAAGGETFTDLSVSHTRWMISMSGGRLAVSSAGTTQTFPGSPTAIQAITAHIREDRFYCYDSDGNTYYTTADGGNAFTQGIDLPQTGSNIKVRGLWRDGDIVDLLYFAAGTAGAYKTTDGFRSSAGYYRIRQPGIGSSPGSSNYTQVGLDGGLTLPQIGEQGIFVGTSLGLIKRIGPNLYQQIGASDITDDVRHLVSPYGFPLIIYVITDTVAKKTLDGGVTWANFTLPAGSEGTLHAVDNSSTLLFMTRNGTSEKGVYRSVDGGANWTVRGGQAGIDLFGGDKEIYYDPVQDLGWVLLGDQGGGASATIYKSSDEFANLEEFADIPGSPNTPWAHFPRETTGLRGVFGVQAGAAFNRPMYRIYQADVINFPQLIVPVGDTDNYVHALAMNANNTVVAVWVHDAGTSLLRSASFGENWTEVIPVGQGVSTYTIKNLAGKRHITYNPTTPEFWVHAGDWPWIFISTNDGLTWTREDMSTAFPTETPDVTAVLIAT